MTMYVKEIEGRPTLLRADTLTLLHNTNIHTSIPTANTKPLATRAMEEDTNEVMTRPCT